MPIVCHNWLALCSEVTSTASSASGWRHQRNSALTNGCGTCHMASLFLTLVPGASINAYSMLWDSSTSLPISTATGPSCNIGTHRSFIMPPQNGPSHRTTTDSSSASSYRQRRCTAHYWVHSLQCFSSIRTPTFFSCLTVYPATLKQGFYCRNELLARNSTGRLSTPTGADQEHTGVHPELSEKISSWPTTLLALLLISNGHAHLRSTVPLLSPLSTIFFFNTGSNIFSCITLRFWCKIFITEMSFWLGIALASSVHLQEQFNSTQECHTSWHPEILMQDFYYRNKLLARNSTGKLSTPARPVQQHTRVPYKLSEEISGWLVTLLVLLLMSNGDAHLTTSVSLPSPLSSMIAFLLQTQLPYGSHASVTGPAQDSHLPYKANSYFTSY